MTQLDDKLRTALLAKASHIPLQAPPLELQPARRRVGSVTRRGGGSAWPGGSHHWLAPLATIAAVAVVLGASLILASLRPARPVSPAAPVAPVQTNVPPYSVALVGDRLMTSRSIPTTVATVRDTATGSVLARITPPSPYVRFNYVSGATDDRTFVLLASGRRKHNGVTPERFYLLRINPSAASPAGRARLTALAPSDVSGANEVEEMALSPDGQALAAVLTRGIWDYLYVYYLRTGGTRIWIRQLCSDCRQTELGATNFLSPGTVDLSWAQNGKTLAFVPSAADNSLRLLTVSKPGSNVQLTSKVLPIRGVPFGGQWFVIDMTPDGKTVYVSYPAGRGRSEWMGLGRFSEVTSKFTVLNYLTTSNEGHGTGYDPGGNLATDNVLWTSYNGSKAIVMDAQPGQTAGVYSGGQYTPLRWPANVVDAAW